MKQRARPVWSSYRKLMANLLPLLCWVPLAVAGIVLFQENHRALAFAVWALVPVAGWLGINQFGLFQNEAMKRELRILRPAQSDRLIRFVGIATPKHRSLLDAHEDVGWLVLDEDALRFLGERKRIQLPKQEIRVVRFRPNVHSLLGLGRWVAVEGMHEGKRFFLRVEPREHGTLLANRREGARLLAELQSWLRSDCIS
jgi:hypothetical protein